MKSPTKRLGRGLASLLTHPTETVPARIMSAEEVAGTPRRIPIDQLQPNHFQPRHKISSDGIRSLAASLKSNGMIQPIVVRPYGELFQIVAGERRWHAARLAGWADIPAMVANVDERQMLEFALIENIHREDLNAIDRAGAYARYAQEFGLSPEQIAERIGEDRTTVTNYLRLLELERDVQQLVADGRLSMGHARALLGVQDSRVRLELAKRVMAQGLSVRAVEELVRQSRAGKGTAAASKDRPGKRPHVRDLEERFAEALGLKVEIAEGSRKNTGRVILHYASLDDFDRIVTRLGVSVG
jgi:ParB family chromosome partitioning protein